MLSLSVAECSIKLEIEPLSGALAQADHQTAWEVYLACVATARRYEGAMPSEAIRELLRNLYDIVSRWPMGQVKTSRREQLGFVVVAFSELLLRPSLRCETAHTLNLVCTFCDAFAEELAHVYGFPNAGAKPPADLIEAWKAVR